MPNKLIVGILFMTLALSFLTTSCDQISNIGNVATTESITYHMALVGDDGVTVNIKPTSRAKANIVYRVDLYESGRFRMEKTTMWDESELQVSNMHQIFFALPYQELNAFISSGKDSNDVFSVKVFEYKEPTESQILQSTIPNTAASLPSLTLISPRGGEILHVGDTVTITWTTTNMPNVPIDIDIIMSDTDTTRVHIVSGAPNNGNYKWTVAKIITGNSIIGNNKRIAIKPSNNSNPMVMSGLLTIADSMILDRTTQNTAIPNQYPTLTVTYPKGGEIWHVGDTVTITWTSANIPKDDSIKISINLGDKKGFSITQSTPNTGSYKWIVPKSLGTYPVAGTSQIYLICNELNTYGNSNSGIFTIAE